MDSQCPPDKGACDKDGYYRSTSSDGIHWVDDVVRMLANNRPTIQRESYRVGPKVAGWPKILSANPY